MKIKGKIYKFSFITKNAIHKNVDSVFYVRSQKSEVRSQKSEVRSQMSKV